MDLPMLEQSVVNLIRQYERERLADFKVDLKSALEKNERLEVVIHGIRRMAESGCDLKHIIDTCEAEFPEPLPRNGE